VDILESELYRIEEAKNADSNPSALLELPTIRCVPSVRLCSWVIENSQPSVGFYEAMEILNWR
jgi:hypothetical protein